MRALIALSILLISVSAVLSGCATMRYPSGYKVEGKEFKEFKELDDEKALKLIAMIYNVKTQTWEDGIARSISLEEYQNLVAKRNSNLVKNSGVFKIEYERVKLSKWKDEDLIKLYKAIAEKADAYYMDATAELSEIQNAQRITCLTALNSVAKELKKRENTKSAINIACQIMLTALSAALAMI